MSGKSNRKGKAGERDLIRSLSPLLDGVELERNPYKQQKEAGHADINGIDWLSLEVKRYAKCLQGDVRSWWTETCQQAVAAAVDGVVPVPVLAYRADRQEWRVVVPLGFISHGRDWLRYMSTDHLLDYTAELTLQAFAAIVRRELLME